VRGNVVSMRGEYRPVASLVIETLSSRLTCLIVSTDLTEFPCGCVSLSPSQHRHIECQRNKYISETPYCLRVSLPPGKARKFSERARDIAGGIILQCTTRPHAFSCKRFSIGSLYVFISRSRYSWITFRTNNFRWIY